MPYQGRLPYTYKSPFNTTLDQGTQTVPSLAFLGDTNNGLFSPATDNVAITTNGSEKLRVTSGGFVGIGTTNPSARLQVQGDIYLSGSIRSASDLQYSFNPLSWQLLGGGYITESNTTNGYIQIGEKYVFGFDVPTGGKINLQTNGSSFFTGGNVGIGTTNPSAKLHIQGTANEIWLRDSGTKTLALQTSNDIQYIKAIDVGVGGLPLEFYASRYNFGTGNVGIGTTNPEDRLDLASGFIRFKAAIGGTGTYGGIRAYNSLVPSISATEIRFIRDVAEVGNDGAICFDTTNNERVRISSTGNVGIGTTNPSEKLHVYSASSVSSINIDSGNSGTTIYYNLAGVRKYTTEYVPANDFYSIGRSGVAYDLTLKNGNVGIGTTNPTQKLVSTGNIKIQGEPSNVANLIFTRTDVSWSLNNETEFRIYSGSGTTDSPSTLRLNINGSTGSLTPGADATQDLGSTTKRWANIYSADLQLSNEGSSNDVDGTWGAYTIQEGENDLYLLNRRNGKKYKFVLQEVN